MKVVFKDLKHGEVKLVPENLDDIWHLYNVIDAGDLVRMVAFRTSDEGKDDKIRSKKTDKKRMKLGVRVKEVKFHEFSDRLRIHGTIEEGPQDLGSFHTLNVDADKMEAVSIVKEKWKHYQLERIDEAVKLRSQPLLTFVSLDEENATVAVLRQSGVQWVADIDSRRSGKMYESVDNEKEYFGEILSVVRTNKDKNSPLVVVGPGFTKEHFIEYGKEKESLLFEKCFSHGTGSAGMAGVQEAIKTGVVEKITKENRVVFETQLVEKLFEEIKKDLI
jgi:protein pelota